MIEAREIASLLWLDQLCTAEFGYRPAFEITGDPNESWLKVSIRPPAHMLPATDESKGPLRPLPPLRDLALQRLGL